MIKVENLKKSFGNNEVLKEINVEIKPQEVVVVIGPSGSGKSTFLRCLNLLETITDGHVYIEGTDITDSKTNINDIRTEVGMVFQQFNLFPHKSVMENIMMAPIHVRKWEKEKARQKGLELLRKVGLLDKADAYPDSLSGGQKQRVAIARAMIHKPKVLFADEPTASLDSKRSKDIMILIRDLTKTLNITTLMVTHDEEMLSYADHIIKMSDGLILKNED